MTLELLDFSLLRPSTRPQYRRTKYGRMNKLIRDQTRTLMRTEGCVSVGQTAAGLGGVKLGPHHI